MKARGSTLVEVLVTVTIVALLVGLIGSVLVSGKKSSEVDSANALLQQSAQAGLHRVADELRESHLANLTMYADGRGIAESSTRGFAMPSARPATSTHSFTLSGEAPSWQSWIGYYVAALPNAPSCRALYRVQFPLVDINNPPTLAQVTGAAGRLLICDTIVPSGTTMALTDSLTSDPLQASIANFIGTPFTASGGLVTFTYDGFLAQIVRTWGSLQGGTQVELARPRVRVCLTAASLGLGTRQVAGMSAPAQQRYNVTGDFTEVEVKN